MKKPKILITMHYMELGGAESALLGLLQSVDPSRADVDVFIYAHRGELMEFIPKDRVRLLPEKSAYASLESTYGEALRRGQWGMILGRLIARYKGRKYSETLTPEQRANDISIFPLVTKCCMPFLPSLKDLGEYDLAISFLQPHNIVLEKLKAKRKVAWIHTDYSTVHVNADFELGIWSKYDKIAGISDDAVKSFLKTFSSLSDKTIVIENILSSDFVNRRAEIGGLPPEYLPYKDTHTFILCSVGRICRPKNYDNLPWMAAGLKKRGVKFHWFVVGPGSHDTIDEDCRKLGVDDCVTFVGARSNPYPYIKNCTLYVQPSRYEGKSVTVREAQVLGRPVVITNYPTAHSQVIDGVDGVICPMENDAIADAIASLLQDEAKMSAISAYLQTHDYSNADEIEKIYQLAEGNIC